MHHRSPSDTDDKVHLRLRRYIKITSHPRGSLETDLFLLFRQIFFHIALSTFKNDFPLRLRCLWWGMQGQHAVQFTSRISQKEISPERWLTEGNIVEQRAPLAGMSNGMVCIIEIIKHDDRFGKYRTLRAAVAAARRSSRAFSFCLRFFRKVSGTSMSYVIKSNIIVSSCMDPVCRSWLTETVGTLGDEQSPVSAPLSTVKPEKRTLWRAPLGDLEERSDLTCDCKFSVARGCLFSYIVDQIMHCHTGSFFESWVKHS